VFVYNIEIAKPVSSSLSRGGFVSVNFFYLPRAEWPFTLRGLTVHLELTILSSRQLYSPWIESICYLRGYRRPWQWMLLSFIVIFNHHSPPPPPIATNLLFVPHFFVPVTSTLEHQWPSSSSSVPYESFLPTIFTVYCPSTITTPHWPSFFHLSHQQHEAPQCSPQVSHCQKAGPSLPYETPASSPLGQALLNSETSSWWWPFQSILKWMFLLHKLRSPSSSLSQD